MVLLPSVYKFTYLENTTLSYYKGRSNCKLSNEVAWIAVRFLWPLSRTTSWVTSERPKNELHIFSYINDNKNCITTHTTIHFVYVLFCLTSCTFSDPLPLFTPSTNGWICKKMCATDSCIIKGMSIITSAE